MNKKELINAINLNMDLSKCLKPTKRQIGLVLYTLIQIINDLPENEFVRLNGIGKFVMEKDMDVYWATGKTAYKLIFHIDQGRRIDIKSV